VAADNHDRISYLWIPVIEEFIFETDTFRRFRSPSDLEGQRFCQVQYFQLFCIQFDAGAQIGFAFDALNAAGHTTELIGTGQTAWMQGVRYGIILDSIVNDFVAGEIENAIWNCWKGSAPQVMVLEGQGSLMNPAYPGGMELLAAGRPHAIILQHAPARKHYDGFPKHPMHSLEKQILAVETLSEKPVLAITINHENLTPHQVREECRRIREKTGLPASDVLLNGASELVNLVTPLIQRINA